MSYKKHYLSAVAIAVILLTACKKETFNPTVEVDTSKSSLIKISEAYAIGSATKVELWSDSEISIGYQKLFVALYDSITKKPITRSVVEILPIIDKKIDDTVVKLSVPVENPESFDANQTLFQCAAVFTTPSYGDLAQWKIKIMLKKAGQNKFTEVQMPIFVKPAAFERVKTIDAADGSKLTITLVTPLNPRVGLNDLEFIINNTVDLFTYNFDNSHSVDIRVEIPLKKISSSDNINPSYTSKGRYKGKVNFTMSGNWRINLNLLKNKKTVSTFFDISV